MNTNKKVVDAPTLTTKTGLIMLIHYKLPRHWIYSLTAALMMTAIDFPSAAAAPIVQSKNSYLSSRRFPVTNQSNQLKLKRVMLRDPLVQPATYPQENDTPRSVIREVAENPESIRFQRMATDSQQVPRRLTEMKSKPLSVRSVAATDRKTAGFVRPASYSPKIKTDRQRRDPIEDNPESILFQRLPTRQPAAAAASAVNSQSYSEVIPIQPGRPEQPFAQPASFRSNATGSGSIHRVDEEPPQEIEFERMETILQSSSGRQPTRREPAAIPVVTTQTGSQVDCIVFPNSGYGGGMPVMPLNPIACWGRPAPPREESYLDYYRKLELSKQERFSTAEGPKLEGKYVHREEPMMASEIVLLQTEQISTLKQAMRDLQQENDRLQTELEMTTTTLNKANFVLRETHSQLLSANQSNEDLRSQFSELATTFDASESEVQGMLSQLRAFIAAELENSGASNDMPGGTRNGSGRNVELLPEPK